MTDDKICSRYCFRRCLIVAVAATGFADGRAQAAPVTVPINLAPGSQFRLVFIGEAARDGMSANIDDYNAFVTAVANTVPELVSLGTTWKAICSTPTVAARDNTGTNPLVAAGVPIYDLTGFIVAFNYADLWDGTIDSNGIRTNEKGERPLAIDPIVFTGTAPDGTPADGSLAMGTPLGQPLQPTFETLGRPFDRPNVWITDGTGPSNVPMQFMAMSGLLTVPFLPVAGDYNQNGIVDAADYTIWRDKLGSGTALHNDDTDGVGQDDYTRWKNNFGQHAGSGSIANVPEPSTAALLVSGCVVAMLARRR
jgi:hypothetical protein